MNVINLFRGKYAALGNLFQCYLPCPLTGAWKLTSLEQAYLASKFVGQHNPEAVRHAEAIMDLNSKVQGDTVTFTRLGREPRYRRLRRPGWEGMKLGVMRQLVGHKFGPRNPDCVACLLSTGDAALVNVNRHHANFYGWCVRPNCGDCPKGTEWHNHLGLLMMTRRDELKVEGAAVAG